MITGHTGFKGSWLSLWLEEEEADLMGFALTPSTDPNHFDLLDIDMRSVIGDIRDREGLIKAVQGFQPEMVFHLAAQPLVRHSYRDPAGTFETNVMGTIHLLDACRKTPSVRAVVNVTSDKCYENREWVWGYRECDPMGGFDPYSASKGCSELVTAAYRNSFFHPERYRNDHDLLLASARAGNVIGGGDWAEDRLIPDIMRAAGAGESSLIRNPNATRPWQHVLEPLAGYLLLGRRLLEGDAACAGPWNFGPPEDAVITVGRVAEGMKRFWKGVRFTSASEAAGQPHEANLLKLDSSKANALLGWRCVWDLETTLRRTVEWYRNFYESGRVGSRKDLSAYIRIFKTAHERLAVNMEQALTQKRC